MFLTLKMLRIPSKHNIAPGAVAHAEVRAPHLPLRSGPYLVALSVGCGERMRSFFIFVGNTCTHNVFGNKPDLQLVPAKHVADQQVIGSIVRSEEHTSELQS